MTTTEPELPDPNPELEPQQPVSSWRRRLLPATRGQRIAGALALMFLAGSLGYLIGTRDSDFPSADSADVGFLYDMSAHHEQAVQLSMIELANGSDPSVQVFAREIVRSQSYEIGLMRMRLAMWGFDPGTNAQAPMAWMGMALPGTDVMPGMADPTELDAFRKAKGSDADALFLALMNDHHAGGVAMAEDAARRADDGWIIDTAQSMARIQASEIIEMELAREKAGLPATPDGFVAAFGPDGSPMGDMDIGDSDSDMDLDTESGEGG